MFCSKCGNQESYETMYCSKCGTKMNYSGSSIAAAANGSETEKKEVIKSLRTHGMISILFCIPVAVWMLFVCSSLEAMDSLAEIKEKAAKTKTIGWIINIAITVIAILFAFA